MTVIDLVDAYAGLDGAERRTVVVLPRAEGLRERLSGSRPAEEAPSDADNPRVLVDLAAPGAEVAALEEVASRLGKRDVAVMLLRGRPESLAIGPLISSVTAAGLRVVQAQALGQGRSETVVVVTRDPEVPQRSYLLGAALPDTAEATLRMQNEWAVEGLQLRALVAAGEEKHASAQQELEAARAEADRLRAERQAAQDEARTAREEATAARAAAEELHARMDRRWGPSARRALGAIREDPRHAAPRLLRRLARRLRS